MNCRQGLHWSVLLVASVTAACAGNGDGLDSNGRPLVSGDPGTGPLTADFQSIQDHVLTPICTACHAGAGAPQGLRLDAANSYDLLVGVPSTEVPSVDRVKPGDPDHSYLVQKLEGRAAVGARMPFGGPYLDQATIDVIRQWITDGAQRAAASTSVPTFKVSTVIPATGDRVPLAPALIVVGFTRDLDRTRVDASVLQLGRVEPGTDGEQFVPVPAVLSAPDGNASAIVVRTQVPLVPGRYVLRAMRGALADLVGTPLDDMESSDKVELTLTDFEVEGTP